MTLYFKSSNRCFKPCLALLILVAFQLVFYSCSEDEDVLKDQELEQKPDTWIIVADLGEELTKVQFVNDEIGFALGQQSIFKTTNGGKSWNALPNIPTGSSIVDIHVVNETVIVAIVATSAGLKLATTINSATSWILTTAPSETVNKTYFVSSTVGFAWRLEYEIGRGDEAIFESYRTGDGGTSWTKMKRTTDEIINPINFLFSSATTGYATHYSRILKTEDGGLTWQNGTLLTDILTSLTGTPGNFCLLKSTPWNDEIYISSDAITWEYIGPNPYGIGGGGSLDRNGNLIFYREEFGDHDRILKNSTSTPNVFQLETLPEIRTGDNTAYQLTDITITDSYGFAVGSRPNATANEKPGFVLRYKR
jgi:hypothetical protein